MTLRWGQRYAWGNGPYAVLFHMWIDYPWIDYPKNGDVIWWNKQVR